MGFVVLDLSAAAGLASILMARECVLVIHAADLWGDSSDNMRLFDAHGLASR